MQSIRVLIVDDHPMALEGIQEILKEDASFQVIGEAMTGKDAIAQTEALMPDLILMDIHLPDMSGKEATKRIKAKFPYVKIVMVTVSHDIVDLFDSIKYGAQGYLLKHLDHESWLPYLKSIMNDDTPIDQMLAEQMLQEFFEKEAKDVETHVHLSGREREILTWVAKGLTNKEIALQLEISEYTVKNHLKNLFQKLHLNNRVQLAKYAYEHGLVTPKKADSSSLSEK